MKKETGSAFPHASYRTDFGVDTPRDLVPASCGMTLRDYFAAKVMAALVPLETATQMDDIARDAYMQADYMLAERAKP